MPRIRSLPDCRPHLQWGDQPKREGTGTGTGNAGTGTGTGTGNAGTGTGTGTRTRTGTTRAIQHEDASTRLKGPTPRDHMHARVLPLLFLIVIITMMMIWVQSHRQLSFMQRQPAAQRIPDGRAGTPQPQARSSRGTNVEILYSGSTATQMCALIMPRSSGLEVSPAIGVRNSSAKMIGR